MLTTILSTNIITSAIARWCHLLSRLCLIRIVLNGHSLLIVQMSVKAAVNPIISGKSIKARFIVQPANRAHPRHRIFTTLWPQILGFTQAAHQQDEAELCMCRASWLPRISCTWKLPAPVTCSPCYFSFPIFSWPQIPRPEASSCWQRPGKIAALLWFSCVCDKQPPL